MLDTTTIYNFTILAGRKSISTWYWACSK